MIRGILKEFYKNNIEPPCFGGRRPKLFPDGVHTTIVSGKPVHFPNLKSNIENDLKNKRTK